MNHACTREKNGNKIIDRCEHGTVTMINDDGIVIWYTCTKCKAEDDAEAEAKVAKEKAFYRATRETY